MPLDHFISQVHLRNFYSKSLGKRMYGTSKKNLKTFCCQAKDVCRILDGSTNAYLLDKRIIEEFLKDIEPKYNSSVQKLRNGTLDAECIYVIAGFVAYIQSCSPTAMRMMAPTFEEPLEETSKILDAQGKLPPPPPELGAENFTQLFENGTLKITVDPKYPQAVGISQIIKQVELLGNFIWEILINDYADSPFFTCDYPIAIERQTNSGLCNKIVPLAPNLALRIIPNINVKKEEATLKFSYHRFTVKKLGRKQVSAINQLIVRCAEDLVFHVGQRDWITKFISKHHHYRVELVTEKINTSQGTFFHATQDIVEFKSS